MEFLGVMAALLATVSWSVAPIAIRLSVGTGTSLPLVAGARALFALVVLLPATVVTGASYSIRLEDLILVLISGLLVGISDLFYIEAIKRLGSWRAILIGYQYILIAQILTYLVLKESEGIVAVFFTPVALIGVYVALKDDRPAGDVAPADYLIAYVPAVLWGTATVLSRYLTGTVDALLIATYRSMFIALVFIALGAKRLGSLRALGLRKLGGVLLSGLLTHVGGFVSFLYALKLAGTFISTLVNSLGPLITQVVSSRVCGERLGSRHVLGVVITVSAIAATLVLSLAT